MSSSVGNILKITIFGESHNTAIGMVIDGLPSGILIDQKEIELALKNRKIDNDISTSRNEEEKPIFLSGLLDGYTTCSPLTFIINNKDIDSSSYQKGIIRPGHSDLTAYLKYDGYNDYRGGGFFSGRIATSFIVLGEICKQVLSNYNVEVFSHIKSVHGIKDDNFTNIEDDIKNIKVNPLPTINKEIAKQIKEEILKIKNEQDSVGGEIETIILNSPLAVGEPYFDSFESTLSKIIFSLGGVKGIYFGDYQETITSLGSDFNDQLKIENNKIEFLSNHNAGINGGITNGEPILFTTIIKPTPTIGKKQQTIDLESKSNISLENKGRNDPCLVHRILPLINAISYYVILDLLMMKESKNI